MPPQSPYDLPETIKSVDDRIANEYDLTHPLTASPSQHGFMNFFKSKRGAILAVFIVVAILGTTTSALLGSKNNQTSVQSPDDTTKVGTSKEGEPEESTPQSEEIADTSTEAPAGQSADALSLPIAGTPSNTSNGRVTEEADNIPPEPMQSGGPVIEPNVPNDPPDSPPAQILDTPSGKSNTISIVTFNYAHWKPAEGIKSAVRTMSSYADIIGFQEFGPSDSRAKLNEVVNECGTCGYALYMPDISNGGNIPIIYKKNKFTVLSKGNVKIYDAQRVEDGAGGPNVTAKHLTWLHLKDKSSGRVFWFINNHLIPSVDANGHPNQSKPQRLALYATHMNKLTSKISQFKSNNTPVFITGDFNVNYKQDSDVKAAIFPYAKMQTVDTWANWRYLGAPSGGTISDGNRVIDYVFETRNNKAIPQSTRVLPQYGSDHHAVEMKVLFK